MLINQQQITARTGELADRISRDYADCVQDPVLIGVLKGAVVFMTDLAKALRIPVRMDYLAVDARTIVMDVGTDIRGRDVLVVEDGIGDGHMLSWLLGTLAARGPASLELCALVRKPAAVRVDVKPRYVGFDLPDIKLVGYGRDDRERFRNLPYICSVPSLRKGA